MLVESQAIHARTVQNRTPERQDFQPRSPPIIKLSKNLSSKQKGSANRERARLDLARKRRRIVNLRKEFHCKT
ncbi:MAG: transposase, partial [Desulfobulbus sp.]|nr:transposase [Desulfobulbus sp.]